MASSSLVRLTETTVMIHATADPTTNASQVPQPLGYKCHVEFSLAHCDLDATVLSFALRRVITGDRVGRAEALRGDGTSGDALGNQEVRN